jgi:integrase
MANVIWNEREARWVLRVTVNGKTHKFTSREPGMAGKRAVLSAAREFNAHGTRNATVNEIRDEWLESIAARLGRSSVPYTQAESLTRLYVLPAIGRKRIRDVKLRDWQSIITDARPVSGSGQLSKKYLSNLRAQINLLMRYAYENEYTEPLRGSLFVPAGRPVIGKDVLTVEQVRALLAPSSAWYWPAWALMLLTGARPGEIYGLRVEDFDGLSITIRRAINARGQITPGKNKNAQRVIPLHPIARQIIIDTIKRNSYLKTPWIFPGKSGGRCYPQTAAKEWRAFASSRNLPGTPYCLRHTFVSMVKNTMPDSLLKNIVGHSSFMDTVAVYGHKMADDDAAALEYIEQAFPS